MTKVGAIIAREMEESEERGRRAGKVEGRSEGKAEGKASALLTFLSAKGEVSEPLEKKIMGQTQSDTLDQWLKIAATVSDLNVIEEQIMQ